MTDDDLEALPLPDFLEDPEPIPGGIPLATILGEPNDEFRWRPTDLRTAEWAMRKLAAAKRHLAELEASAVAWHQSIDRWFERVSIRWTRTMDYFEGALIGYAAEVREADPKAKTLVLPSGQVSSVGRQAAPVITDPEALVQWLERNAEGMSLPLADLVKRTEVKKPVAKAVSQLVQVVEVEPGVLGIRFRGLSVPGVDVRPAETSFTVKPL